VRALTFLSKDLLEWRDLPALRVAGAREAIVRPVASAPCDLDRAILGGRTPLPGPFALGHECAAEVVEIGDSVTRVVPGDLVVVPWHISCGACARCTAGLPASCTEVTPRAMYGAPIGGDWGGLFSEQVRVPHADGMLTKIPAGVPPELAAAASDNLTDAMIAVRRVLDRRPGAPVLVVGGTGCIGLFAVDFARAAGAAEIVYVDKHPDRLALATALGARAVERSAAGDLGEYAAVVDASGHPAELARALRALAPGGACHSVGVYFLDTPVPMLDMYAKDVTFSTGRPSVGPRIADVLSMIAAKTIHPERVITTAPWDDAITVLGDRTKIKPVLVCR
jgi:alcohol dehydrogenase